MSKGSSWIAILLTLFEDTAFSYCYCTGKYEADEGIFWEPYACILKLF